MRVLVWLFGAMWAGGKASLIAGTLLLVMGLLAAYFIVLPYFYPPLKMSAEDFVDLSMPSPLQIVEISGELVDGERGATIDGKRGHYGIIEMDNQLYRLLLVGSIEPLDEDQTEFIGTLSGRDPIHIEVFEDIVDDKNLEGRAIEAFFVIGKPSQADVVASFIVDGVLLVLGSLGLIRYLLMRSKAAATNAA